MRSQATSTRVRAGRAAGALLAAMAALVAGFLAFLLWQNPGAETQATDVPLGTSDLARAARDDPNRPAWIDGGRIDDLPPDAEPANDSAESGTRIAAAEPSAEVTPAYRLELRVVDRQGRPVRGASAHVLEPDEALDPLVAAPGILICETSRLVPHVVEVAGPENDGSPFAEAKVDWVPDPDAPSSEMEVVLHLAARIQGSLQCSDGSSPDSSGIDIFHVESKEWSNAAALHDGTFVSQWMPAGEVIVYSRNGSWSGDDLREREVITLVEGQTYAYQGMLAPAIALAGTVVDAAGRPRPNTPVDIYDALNPQYSESVLSDKDGRFYCDALYPGTYLLDLPKAKDTPKTRFTVERGRLSRDMGHLVHRTD